MKSKNGVMVARWQGLHHNDREHLLITTSAESILAESVIISEAGEEEFGIHYRIVCDVNWNFRSIHSRLLGPNSSSDLVINRDDSGRWTNAAGAELPELSSASVVDLSITPFTNTLPVQTLKLLPGQSADLIAAYIAYPAHTVQADPQRYTCIEKGRFLFESVDTDFKSEFTVDEHGLIKHYPHMFVRIS